MLLGSTPRAPCQDHASWTQDSPVVCNEPQSGHHAFFC